MLTGCIITKTSLRTPPPLLYYRHHPNPLIGVELDPCKEAGLLLKGAEINLKVLRAEVDMFGMAEVDMIRAEVYMIKVAEEVMIRVVEVEVDVDRVAELDRFRVAEAGIASVADPLVVQELTEVHLQSPGSTDPYTNTRRSS